MFHFLSSNNSVYICSMLKYVKPSNDKSYIDLIVSYEGNEEDEMGPPVRYYYNG